MSLARLLKRKIEGKQTLQDLVDEQFEEKKEAYSLHHLKEKAQKFQEYLSEENVDGDKLQKLFFDLYSAMYADKPRSGKRIHPSTFITDCERMLYYEFTDAEPTNAVPRKINAQTQRIFDVGTWWHTYIQNALWKSGLLEKSEVPVKSRKKRISGHTDGIIVYKGVRYLIEIKTMNSFQFAKGKMDVFTAHSYQASLYASELGLSDIVYIYVNKDTSEIKYHFEKVNELQVKNANDKIQDINQAIVDGVPPKRICEDIYSHMAKTCPFKTLCFK